MLAAVPPGHGGAAQVKARARRRGAAFCTAQHAQQALQPVLQHVPRPSMPACTAAPTWRHRPVRASVCLTNTLQQPSAICVCVCVGGGGGRGGGRPGQRRGRSAGGCSKQGVGRPQPNAAVLGRLAAARCHQPLQLQPAAMLGHPGHRPHSTERTEDPAKRRVARPAPAATGRDARSQAPCRAAQPTGHTHHRPHAPAPTPATGPPPPPDSSSSSRTPAGRPHAAGTPRLPLAPYGLTPYQGAPGRQAAAPHRSPKATRPTGHPPQHPPARW